MMEHFFDFLKEVLKGIICAGSAFVFHKILLKKEKSTHRRRKQGGSQK